MRKLILEGETEETEAEIREFFGPNAPMIIMREDEYKHWVNVNMVLMFLACLLAGGFGWLGGYIVWGM
jgi:hypothetical protein